MYFIPFDVVFHINVINQLYIHIKPQEAAEYPHYPLIIPAFVESESKTLMWTPDKFLNPARAENLVT